MMGESNIAKYITEIDDISAKFSSSFSSLNQKQLNWKPNPNTWSIAQILEHLILINETYVPIINEAKTGQLKLPFTSKFKFMVSFFGKMILKSVEPERKRKMRTFSIWEPTQSEIAEGVLARFLDHQERLKLLIEESKELLAQDAIIISPANKNITYQLLMAFEIIIMHEKRHLNQCLESLHHLSN